MPYCDDSNEHSVFKLYVTSQKHNALVLFIIYDKEFMNVLNLYSIKSARNSIPGGSCTGIPSTNNEIMQRCTIYKCHPWMHESATD